MQPPSYLSRLINHQNSQLEVAERYINELMVSNLQLHGELERARTEIIEATAGGRPETQQALLSVLSVMEEALERKDRFYHLEYQRMYADKEIVETLARLAGRLT